MVKSNVKNTEMYMHSNDICRHCRGLRDLFCHVESVNIEMFENTESVMLCSFLEAQRSTKVPNEQRQASGIFVVNNELVIGIMVNEGKVNVILI